jgi:hypothetical protein
MDNDEREGIGFKEYFEALGYKYNWDFDSNGHFHEILDSGGLTKLQIDFGPTLQEVINDFCTLEKTVTTWSSYGPQESYDEVVNKVREFEKSKIV